MKVWKPSIELRDSLLGYTLTALLSVAAFIVVYRSWRADWDVPFKYGIAGDCTVIQMWMKCTLETGWYLHDDRLGAPFGYDMHDYPTADHLHIVLMKLLGMTVSRDFATVLNLYFLLGFPLAALTSAWTCRQLGVSWGPAILCSLLFAFTPYHLARGVDHLFLASYFMIPPLVLVALRIAQDQFWIVRRNDMTGLRQWFEGRRELLLVTTICVLVASAGIYYAFFGCILLGAAGVYSSVQRRRWYPLFTAGSAGVLIAIVLGVLLSPTLLYALRHGRNPDAVQRNVNECETYGLRINEYFMPLSGHPLATLLPETDKPGWVFYLGVIGAVGFVVLLGWLLLNRTRSNPKMDSLAVLNGAAILISTTGGFGWLFNHMVIHWIRCYHRIAAYVAFFSLLAIALLLQQLFERYAAGTAARRWLLFFVAVATALGVIDQSTPSPPNQYEESRVAYRSDATFVRNIEESLPHGSQVFQLPIMSFPEVAGVHNLKGYNHLDNYLHSHHLRWSFGGMKGRFGDRWQQAVGQQTVQALLHDLALAGFAGIQVDRLGYPDDGKALEKQLSEQLHTDPVVSPNQKKSFFKLTAVVKKLHQQYSPAEWEQQRESVMHPVFVRWGDGFSIHEVDEGGVFRWCGHRGQLLLENPDNCPRSVVLKMKHRFATPVEKPIRVLSPLLDTAQVLPQPGTETNLKLIVPPGKHQLQLETDAPALDLPDDQRTLVFRLFNLRVLPDATDRLQTAGNPAGQSGAR